MRSLVLLSLFLAYLPSIFLQPFCGILLWTWFSIMNPHRLVWGIGAEIPYAMVIALATLFAWLMSQERKAPPPSAVVTALVGLMITISISTLFALSPDAAAHRWSIVIKTLIMALLTLTLLNSKVRIHAFVWVMVLSLGYFGIKGGVFSIITGGAYRVYGPAQSYIYDNNHLALALVMAIPLMHFLQLQSRHRWVRFGLITMQICSVIAAVGSYSRGSFLALLAMGTLIWWRSSKKFGLTILGAALAIGVYVAAPAQWFERMNTITTYQEDNSAMARFAIWETGLVIFREHPLFGGGFRATYSQAVVNQYVSGAVARAVHNSHLELLIENGVFGFFFHVILVCCTWIYGQRVRRVTYRRPEFLWARDLASMLQTSLAAYVTGGTFLSLGYYDGWYNIAIAMTALYCLVLRQMGQETTPQSVGATSFRSGATSDPVGRGA